MGEIALERVGPFLAMRAGERVGRFVAGADYAGRTDCSSPTGNAISLAGSDRMAFRGHDSGPRTADRAASLAYGSIAVVTITRNALLDRPLPRLP